MLGDLVRTGKDSFRTGRRLRAALLTSSALTLAWALPATPARAQDATWLASPATNTFSLGANWDTGTVPTGTAYFGATNTNNLRINSGAVTPIGGWTFTASAPAYTFDNNYNANLRFDGAGIVVNGGSVTIDNTQGQLSFRNSSTAGSAVVNNLNSLTYFYDNSSAGNASITNTGAGLSFYNSSTAGSASITHNSGFLDFFDSSTAGSATITSNAGILFFGSSTAGNASITGSGRTDFVDHSTAGSASITVNYYLSFNDNSTAGSATLLNNAGGLVDFSNTTGPNGDHKISAGSIAGAGSYNLGANELTTGSNNLSTEVSGVIAGTGGSLVKVGTGTLTLSGANTYDGGTTINGGTLQLGSAGGIGSILGTVTVGSGAKFDLINADTSGITGISNGGNTYFRNSTSAGSTHITNNANLVFYDTSTAASARVTNNDQMRFTGTSTAGNASITNNQQLLFTASSTAGNATITNNNQLTFDTNATAGSATITNNNQLTFDSNATAGSADIINVGHTLFSGNSTPGNAQLFNSTPNAVFDLSMTSGPNNDNKLTAGSLAGMGTFELGHNELTVGSNNLSTNVTGVIADGGSGGGTGASLVKTGSGTLTLSGVNTYTGATTIDGGTLAINGSILASSGVTVNAGGVLGGTGIIGNTTIANGGTLAPGNSIGTLTVSGNLTFTAGSFYKVEVSTSAADRTNVSGTATLTGATVQAVAIPGSFRGQTFTLLNATGGFSGTQFAGLTITGSFSPARNPRLTYDLNNVYLMLDPGLIALPAGTSGNQTSVAGSINNAVESGATPPVGFDTLLNMSGAQLNRALSQVSGQPGAATTQAAFNAMQQFLGMLDPLNGGTDGGRNTGSADGGTLGYARRRPEPRRRSPRGLCRGDTARGERRCHRQPLGRVGLRLWRRQQFERQCRGRLEHHHQPHLRHRCRRRLSSLAGHAGRLRARRCRLQFLGGRCARRRPRRCLPGRPLCPPQFWARLSVSRPRLWLARRHHRSHRHGLGHRQTDRELQGQYLCRACGNRLAFRTRTRLDFRRDALCGRTSDLLPSARLWRDRNRRQQPVRTLLQFARHDKCAYRARHARRPALPRQRWLAHLARPGCLGA